MTKDIPKECLISVHKQPVAHTQNHLHMSKKNAEDSSTRCDIGRYTPIDSSESLLCICAHDVYVDQTVTNRQHHKPNRRSDAAPNYATEYLTTDTIYIQILTVT